MLVILTMSCLKTDSLLLPVLERLCLVEILHAVKDTGHELARVSLIVQLLPDGVPQFLKPPLLVLGDDLLISSAEVQSDLSSLEPLLKRSLRLEEGYVGFERF